MQRRRLTVAALAATIAALFSTGAASADEEHSAVVRYDSFQQRGGYTLGDYAQRWSNPYGLGEAAQNDTRNFDGGAFNVRATPFTVGSDYSVFDHLKYLALSNRSFDVPRRGSVTFSSQIKAATPGTVAGLTQHGVYGPSGSWTDPGLAPPPLAPYAAQVLEGQQAGAVMNMIDFCTGQLFDWFVSGNRAFALIERLPTNVTGNTANPNCPGATYVGREKMYTQIIEEVPAAAGVAHKVSITYGHRGDEGTVHYRLDGRPVATVENVGVPLDQQGVHYTGIYPSLGAGEKLGDQIHSFAIGHGLFSLLDAFPFQHPEAPELSVSIPVGSSNPSDAGRARLFGQGANASFDDFEVKIVDAGH